MAPSPFSSLRGMKESDYSAVAEAYRALCSLGEGGAPLLVHEKIKNGDVLTAARAMALFRHSDPVASVVLFGRLKTDQELPAALLSYGLGERARDLIDTVSIAKKAAEGDLNARTAIAYMYNDSSLLPRTQSAELQAEMRAVQEARDILLQRNEDEASEILEHEDSKAMPGRMSSMDSENSHSDFVDIQGVKIQRRPRHPNVSTSAFCLFNEHVHVALRDLAGAIASGIPVLLDGPAGCGKTELVNYLAEVTGNSSAENNQFGLVRIHLDSSAGGEEEFNDMIGALAPNQKGSFQWKAGPIGLAIEEGLWLVLEGLAGPSAANSSAGILSTVESIAKLKPGDVFTVPGRSDGIHVGVGFRVIATRTTRTEQRENWEPPGGWQTWMKICMKEYSGADLATILNSRFQQVDEFTARVKASIQSVNAALSTSPLYPRIITLRDGVKLCKRLERISNLTLEKGLADAVDITCAAEASLEGRNRSLAAACESWSVLPAVGQALDESAMPFLEVDDSFVRIGRATLERRKPLSKTGLLLAQTGQTVRLMERIARAIEHSEPVLLNGESGTGKTATVQELARLCGRTLTVVNMSQQSDVYDLMGGYRPIDGKRLSSLAASRFEQAFCNSFSKSKNQALLKGLRTTVKKGHPSRAVKIMREVMTALPSTKRTADAHSSKLWEDAEKSLWDLQKFVEQEETDPTSPSPPKRRRKVAFNYSEGSLLSAMKSGSWILLDEINLASAETLERLVGLLDYGTLPSPDSSGGFVRASPGFTIFAAMNPPTDIGKKALPEAVRLRFTEFFVADTLSMEDLTTFVCSSLYKTSSSSLNKSKKALATSIASFFLECRTLAEEGNIEDADGKIPRFSLRSLSRLLQFALGQLENLPPGLERRALYEGALLTFVTPLPQNSRKPVIDLALKFILQTKSGLPTKKLADLMHGADFVRMEGFWIHPGKENQTMAESSFVVTPSVARTLEDVARAVAVGARKLPVLLQGPTAAGKTSLVTYLAHSTNHRVVRINNHEHTDLSEYVGGYTVDEGGMLAFQDGPLVQAARNGWWVILDELNLAPGDVLEALNRLLDDNREIRVPETGEVVKAASDFALFATQNPPGIYGGRKQLSQAFRSRFIEIQVDGLPDSELRTILTANKKVPDSFASKMIQTMKDLQIERSRTRLFRGKEGFVTARDLFRWASRLPVSREELISAGYCLLGERARTVDQVDTIKNILQKDVAFKFSPEVLYDEVWLLPKIQEFATELEIAPTRSMKRMVALLWECAKNKEPALLVGETGGGKTTACQVVSKALGTSLFMVNLHRHSEASDFIGAFRPARNRSNEDSRLFEWVDGPLVASMRQGGSILLDEINMADHAVTERLNSVLEPERSLLISEKGGTTDIEKIAASEDFRIFATMNPGGDFGKKELSPALQNRFTEIWVQPPGVDDFAAVVKNKLKSLMEAADAIVSFASWCSEKGLDLSLRDAAAWADFIREANRRNDMHGLLAFAHGARLILLDGVEVLKENRVQNQADLSQFSGSSWSRILDCMDTPKLRAEAAVASFSDPLPIVRQQDRVYFGPFDIPFGSAIGNASEKIVYSFKASGTIKNSARIARAFVLQRAILLEGPPGVGKTSLIEALAGISRNEILRVNLSEHTEMSDLLGSDVPTAVPGQFVFKEGPLLKAMQSGHWILLDELNLASQSVLEGLNSVLDHRRSVFIPDLGIEVKAAKGFKLFGAQNPASQGGGRRRLPRSFINRFTRVYIEALDDDDMILIAENISPWVTAERLEALSRLVRSLREMCDMQLNLRDVLRWCELQKTLEKDDDIFDVIVLQRLNNINEKCKAVEAYEAAYSRKLRSEIEPKLGFSESVVSIGEQKLPCGNYILPDEFTLGGKRHPQILNSQLRSLNAVSTAVVHAWPVSISGVSGSGKESIVRSLAGVCRRKLVEVRLTSNSDTGDLLGGYEQYRPEARLLRVNQRVDELASRVMLSLIVAGDANAVGHLEECRIKARAMSHGKKTVDVNSDLETLLSACENFDSQAASGLRKEIELIASYGGVNSPAFCWTRSKLVQAAEAGEWVIIKNVNEVPLAVLDRLNPLLEKPGSATLLAEAPPDESGNPQYFKPHKDFRLFMTMDPRRGDISKALRNRCIEVGLVARLYASVDNLSAFVIGSGVPGPPHAASQLLIELDAARRSQYNEEPSSLQFAVLSRLGVAYGRSWRHSFAEAALKVHPGFDPAELDSVTSSSRGFCGVLDRSVDRIVSRCEVFASELEFEAIRNIIFLLYEMPVAKTCEPYLRVAVDGIVNIPADELVLPSKMEGTAKDWLRDSFLLEVFGLYCLGGGVEDRKHRSNLLAEIKASSDYSAAVRFAANVASISLGNVNGETNPLSDFYVTALQLAFEPLSSLNLPNGLMRVFKTARIVLGQSQNLSPKIARKAFLLVTLIVRSMQRWEKTSHGEWTELSVLWHSLNQNLEESSREQLPVFEGMEILSKFRVEENDFKRLFPVPRSESDYLLATKLVVNLRLQEGDGENTLDPTCRRFIIEALCTLTKMDVSNDIREELTRFADEIPTSDRKKGFQSLLRGPLYEALSMSFTLDVLVRGDRTSAVEALKLALTSDRSNPLLLLSIQRLLWRDRSAAEDELDLLQRLWAWKPVGQNENEFHSAGPAAALVFHTPLRSMIESSLLSSGSRKGQSIEEKAAVMDDIVQVLHAVLSNGSISHIGDPKTYRMLLQYLLAEDRGPDKSLEVDLRALADGLIDAGLRNIEAAIPEHSLDPSIVATVEKDVAIAELVASRGRLVAVDSLSRAQMGHNEAWKLETMEEEEFVIRSANERAQKAEARVVYRNPSAVSYREAWNRLRRLRESHATAECVTSLLQQMERDFSSAKNSESNWQQTVGVVTQEFGVGGSMGHLRDALGAAVLCFERIRLGVRLHLALASIRINKPSVQLVLRELIRYPIVSARQVVDCRPLNLEEIDDAMLHRYGWGCHVFPERASAVLESIHQQVQHWRTSEDAKSLELEEAQSVYTYGSVVRPDETLEEAQERDFEETFGNIEMEYHDENSVNGHKPLPNERQLRKEPQLEELWNVFRAVVSQSYLREGNVLDLFLLKTYRKSFSAVRKLLANIPSIALAEDSSSQSSSCAYLAAIFSLQEFGLEFPEEQEDRKNFYQDGYPVEARAANYAMTDLTERVREVEIALEIMDHPVLERIKVLAVRIATSDFSTPLSAITVSCERLLRLIDEWNRFYATKDLKLAQEKNIAVLCARWRSIELASWPKLLEERVKVPKRKSSKWFPHIYEVVFKKINEGIADDGASTDFKELISVLDKFLRSSTIGELDGRVGIIDIFAKFLDQYQSSSNDYCIKRLRNIFGSLAGYYKILAPKASDHITRMTKPLEDRMKEYTKLGEWDKTNLGAATDKSSKHGDKNLEFFRLKAVADRNRRNLHRLCTDVDGVLRVSLSTLYGEFRNSMGLEELKSQPDFTSERYVRPKLSNKKPDLSSQFMWEGRINRIEDLEAKITSLSHQHLDSTWMKKGIDISSQLEVEGRERALEFLKMEPSRDLVPVKQRALTELLRALSYGGISTQAAQRRYRSNEDWLSSPPTGIDLVDTTFYTCAVRQMKLKEAGGSALNKDVSRRDANVMLGLTDHLFSLLVGDRVSLRNLRDCCEILSERAVELVSASAKVKMSSTVYETILSCSRSMRAMEHEVRHLRKALDAAKQCEMDGKHKPTNPFNPAAVAEKADMLGDLAECIAASSKIDIDSLESKLKFKLHSEEDMQKLVTANDCISEIADSVDCFRADSVSSSFVSAALSIQSTSQNAIAEWKEGQKEYVPSSGIAQEICEKATKCVDSILLAVQAIATKLKSPADEPDGLEGKWALHGSHEAVSQLGKLLHLEGITEQAANLVQVVHDCGSPSEEIIQLLRRVGLVLNAFISHSVLPIVEQTFRLHVESCKLLRTVQCIFITVCQKGFCKPDDEASEEEGESKDVEGTGMADIGSGDASAAQDVSKEIEDEGQLDGLKTNEEHDEEDQPQNPDEDNAIEMSADFEGSASKTEKEDQEKSDEEEEEDEFDKRFGEDDEKDEELDEKLWDGNDEDQPEDDTTDKGKGVEQGKEEAEMGRKEDPEETAEEGKDSTKEEMPEEEILPEPDSEMQDEEPTMQEEEMADTGTKMDTEDAMDNDEGNLQEELPENMQLDGGSSGEESGADESVEDGRDEDVIPEDAPEEEAGADEGDTRKNEEVGDEIEQAPDEDNLPVAGETAREDNQEEEKAQQQGAEEAMVGEDQAMGDIPEQERRDEDMDGLGPEKQDSGKDPQSGELSKQSEGAGGEKDGEAEEGANPDRLSVPELSELWKKRREMMKQGLSETEEKGQEQKDEGEVAEFHDEGEDVDIGAANEDQHEALGDMPPMEDDHDSIREVAQEDDVAKEETLTRPGASGKSDPLDQDQDPREEPTEEMDIVPDEERAIEGQTSQMNVVESHAFISTGTTDMGEDSQHREEESQDYEALGEEVEGLEIDNRLENAEKKWAKLEQVTASGAAMLCEQLRLILEPTIASRLEGDYRTGKRLSMRRVIEFVASDYRRDRIWLRRTKIDKRSYDILICIDDSESMADSGAGAMALEALALLSGALSMLEVGRIAVASFGSSTNLLHSFDADRAPGGGELVSSLRFAQKTTDVKRMVEFSLKTLDEARMSNSRAPADLAQLVIVISDGKLDDRPAIRALVREALTKRQVIAFFLLDNAAEAKQSIRHVKRVEFEDGKMILSPYLVDFPFPFYAVLNNVKMLPEVIADALKQWFELINRS